MTDSVESSALNLIFVLFLRHAFGINANCGHFIVKLSFHFHFVDVLCLQTGMFMSSSLKFIPLLFRRYSFPINKDCWVLIIEFNSTSILKICFAFKHKL